MSEITRSVVLISSLNTPSEIISYIKFQRVLHKGVVRSIGAQHHQHYNKFECNSFRHCKALAGITQNLQALMRLNQGLKNYENVTYMEKILPKF
jgi:hypothetical protein